MRDPWIPEYLDLERDRLLVCPEVAVQLVPDAESLARVFARDIADTILTLSSAGQSPTLILPVGPVDQFPILARIINEERISLVNTVLINMDEYLTDEDAWLPREHPLSFRAFVDHAFYDRLDPKLAPALPNRVFPDPSNPEAIGHLIARRGGVDVCYGGLGINGHLAFNEPPEPQSATLVTNQSFAELATRVLSLARETRAINAVTIGGEISVVPRRCVTVGMREILAARSLRFYANRPWQAGVIRRALFGPIGCDCPASLLRTHPDARLTITEVVAARPEIRLR